MFFNPKTDLKHVNHDAVYKLRRIAADNNMALESKTTLTIKDAEAVLNKVAELAVEGKFPLYKTMRPHDIVPSIRDFKPKKGDYGVGIEYELRPVNQAARKAIIDFVRDMPYVTADSDGGGSLLEITFPPINVSDIDVNTWGPTMLAAYLRDNKLVDEQFMRSHAVGIHVNLSNDSNNGNWSRAFMYGADYGPPLLSEKLHKFYGRRPYGGANNQGKFVEFKMFQSLPDPNWIMWCVNAAIILEKCAQESIKRKQPRVLVGDVATALSEGWDSFFNVKKSNQSKAA